MGDRRTLLAFLIIGLILLAMPYYYELVGIAPPPPPSEPDVATTPSHDEDSTAESEHRPPPQRPTSEINKRTFEEDRRAEPLPSAEIGEFTPRQILVTTPIQHLTFSTAGGVLTSAELVGYTRHDGTPVELLPIGGRGLAVTMTKTHPRRTEIDLSGYEFVPDRESIHLDADGAATLEMTATLPGGEVVVKRLEFQGDRYGIGIEVATTGFAEDDIATVHWKGGIRDAERDWQVDLDVLRVMAYLNESLEEISAEEEEFEWAERGALKWAGVRNKYFMCSLVPTGSDRYWVGMSARLVPVDDPSSFHREKESPTTWPEHNFSVGSRLGGSRTWSGLFYAGPLDYEEITSYTGAELERAMDLGFPVVRDIAQLLLVLFVIAYEYVPNYGVVIVLFALVVKLLVYPLTHKSYESASKMQALQPKITALREKYKNDSQRLSKETMQLYKDEGVNPLGGCLPLLLQMPIFIALYQTFNSAIQLRQAPFGLWIDDLSRPDSLLVAGIDIHVLPLAMSAAMFFQSKMTMKDPKQAALVYIMPLVMVVFMWRFASGLVLYWTIFNVLQIGQQVLTNHLKKKSEPSTTSPAPVAKKRGK